MAEEVLKQERHSTSEYYLLNEKKNNAPETSSVTLGTLLEQYHLQAQYDQMSTSSLPKNYTHLIPDLRMPVNVLTSSSSISTSTQLRDLLTGVPFERPIQTFTEDTLRAAFTLAPVTSIPHVTLMSTQVDSDQKVKGDMAKKEKKRKKAKDELLRRALLRLARSLHHLTFEKWQVQGQASSPFLQAITRENCTLLGVPDYFEFITTPMDLSTMVMNAEEGLYATLEDFRRDLYLVVDNAKTYNRKGEDVYAMAIELGMTYERFVVQDPFGETLQKKKKKKDKK